MSRWRHGARLPGWLPVPAAIGLAFLILPMAGLLARVPWARLGDVLADEAAAQALGLSLRTCLAATAICLMLGVPLALILARGRGRWVALVRTLVSLPMVLPPVVAGLALLVTLGRRGLLGATLRFLGVEIGFTTAAVVLAQAFVSMPFLVASVESAARAADAGYERVAACLGATPTRTLTRVTLPLLAPAVLTGACLAFARSLGEFGATLTFAGSFQGVTRTMPIQVYLRRETDPDLALALALVLLVVAGAVVGGTAAIQGRLGGAAREGAAARPARGSTAARATGPSPRRLSVRPARVSTRWPVRSSGSSKSSPGSPNHRPAKGTAATALVLGARLASRNLDVELTVPAGKVVALVGPNGAGKSTVIDLVTGFLRPDAGTIEIGGRLVTGPRHVPPHRRGVALLAQTPLLFPHLDVAANAAFAPRCAGLDSGAAGLRAQDELAALDCADLAGRRAQQLSGGQAQRVALARAFAADPILLALDEPFAAMDVGAVPAARLALRHRLAQRATAALLVTHDLLDVLSLADEVVVLVEGRVVERGPVAQVVPRPRSRFLAELAGVNLLAGTAVAGDTLDLGAVRLTGLPDEPLRLGRPALAAVAPAAVSIHAIPPGGSPRNTLPGVVETIEPRGSVVRINTGVGGQRLAADITPAAVAELDLVPGSRVHLVAKATQVVLYPGSRE